MAEFPGEDNHWTASNRMEPVEGSQEDSEEEHTSGSVKRLKEFVNSISDLEIKTAIDMIKNAKETDNHAQGLISRNTDFRSAKIETFLFDTGASISLMGQQIARENNFTINRLAKPRNIYEASGAKLDIIGSCDMYIKLKVLGKTKQLRCLILRGHDVDREVLISCKMLKRWDLIHPTFPHETVGSYVRRVNLQSNRVAAIYEKPETSSKIRISKVPPECKQLKANF